jgi:hypothetical protein
VLQDKWAEVEAHLAKAVAFDSNLRVFYYGPLVEAMVFPEALELTGLVEVGLVFRALRGLVEVKCGSRDIVGVWRL